MRAQTRTVIDRAKPLDPELMNVLARSLNDLSASERGNETTRLMHLAAMLEDHFPSLDMRERADMLVSFEFRLIALSQLRKQPEYKQWTSQTIEGGKVDVIHEALVLAAATQPLLERNREPVFAPKPFFERALFFTESMGQA